ncbi:hypothetical protein SAY87_018111 [Trapa incisa]|uniref:RNA polymerase II C-terminal domain phosphatase-like n=1 Tax=Trapa incisa TaxID=236973 RepID=A0AAN7L4W9_9MYRT|nr:hypothetical protein SAY87_018111 [Trapa incisa]
MTIVSDSPVHSSSSDDFASFLDAELATSTSDSSADEEGDEEENLESKRVKRRKVEVLEILEDVQDSTARVETSKEEAICAHPGSFGGMCIICGQRVAEEAGVAIAYIHKGLRLDSPELVRLRNADMKNKLNQKKLHLILDLDHTLLNSTMLFHMTSEEDYLKSNADSLQDIQNGSLFMLEHMRMMTKLRPYVRQFLKEANEMFEMHIYTMGDKPYAREMAKLLDPGDQYFNDRIISRDDGTQKHQKGLDVVLAEESAVLILDDTENAWTKHRENLILMERYHFFASSCQQFGFRCKSLSLLKSDESDTDGALASVLRVLKRVHSMYFDEDPRDAPSNRDVREFLKSVRKEILQGCRIVFSRVFPTSFPPESHQLWKMAEQLGATCLVEVDSSVTHVVANDPNTEKSKWATNETKYLVHPQWIEATYYLWQRQVEDKYPVNQSKSQ